MGGFRRSRRRSSGAARPAASTVQAAARIAVERGTGGANHTEGRGRRRYGKPHALRGVSPPAAGIAGERRLSGDEDGGGVFHERRHHP
jgi:hypothetical protein